ncbi:MFS transporter [Streptomyces sp. NA04227]|nr:MFS transporter [Streptomyces sp. NA04227]
MLAVALSAAFMAVFDLFIVSIATPALRADLDAGDASLELVVSGYAFAYAAGLVTGARLGDRFGYRRMFVLGMSAFAVASLLCALALSPGQLVAARLLQGLTAAAMVPQVLSLITVTFPASHRGRATAWYGAITGLGSLAGQILGGVLVAADAFGLGWRTIFLINVPLALVAVLLALRVLPKGPHGRTARFDPVGAFAVSSALALVLVPLSLGREQGWPVWAWLCVGAAVPTGFLAMRWQRTLADRGGDPVVNPELFRNRPYALLLLAASLYQLYFGSFLFAVPLLVQERLGAGADQAAVVFLLQGLLFTVASMLGGRLVARYGTRVPTAGGSLVVAGMLLIVAELAVSEGDLSSWWLIPPLALVGMGNGFLLPPLLGAALSRVRSAQAGAASGTLNTAQQFANSLGVTLVGGVFLALAGDELAGADTAMEILAVGYAVVAVTLVLLIRAADRAGGRPGPRGAGN